MPRVRRGRWPGEPCLGARTPPLGFGAASLPHAKQHQPDLRLRYRSPSVTQCASRLAMIRRSRPSVTAPSSAVQMVTSRSSE